jgi:multidrug transporter EmrE-like cation transporter
MTNFLIILFVVAFNISGHVFLKAGMNQIGSISVGSLISDFSRVFFNGKILFGLFCYVTSVAGYIVLLSKTDISIAYPIVTSLAYAGIILVSFFIFKELFTPVKWAGLLLIIIGVLMVGSK